MALIRANRPFGFTVLAGLNFRARTKELFNTITTIESR